MSNSSAYDLDRGLELHPGPEPGVLHGQTDPAWANMVGPYGGMTAAVLVRALQQSQCLGEPVALTLNYAAALSDGPFQIVCRAARTNRSTQHWVLELQQEAEGALQTMVTATAVCALRREVWRCQDLPRPEVPQPQSLSPSRPNDAVRWLERYDMRMVRGALPTLYDGSGHDSLTQMWLRDVQRRPLDLCALTAISDAFYPRIWLRRARWVPSGTVSLTVYFHASARELEGLGSDFIYAQARAQDFRYGCFDQTAHFWATDGMLLATAHQIVYYKE
ncbi:MAG: thioesterase family protein [Betaproteobacteria bacterium]